MKVVIQRVQSASVSVDGEVISQIGQGLLVLLGVAKGDEDADFQYVFDKTIGLRIFEDGAGKMNLSTSDVGGELMIVSQFTLLADTRKGKRPSFNASAERAQAVAYYEKFIATAIEKGHHVSAGIFGADMQVGLVNDGPVTIVIDSRSR